jgi:hypothetical protein
VYPQLTFTLRQRLTLALSCALRIQLVPAEALVLVPAAAQPLRLQADLDRYLLYPWVSESRVCSFAAPLPSHTDAAHVFQLR